MSRRFDIQDATGRIQYLAGRGTLQAWGTGAPTNSAAGFAPGCVYHRIDGTSGTVLYVNEGTFSSATWVPVVLPASTALAATVLEISRIANVSSRVVAGGSTLAITVAAHEGRIVQLDTVTGCTITLPDSTGGGGVYRFVVTAIATSNSHIIKVNNASDIMIGMIMAVSDDAGFPVKGYTADATAGADTITLNRGTTGSTVRGEWFEIIDITPNRWAVRGMIAATGTEATPFSATV